MVQRGSQVRVRNLADREVVEHSQVLSHLVLLVLVNRHMSVVDCNEVDQLSVIFDFLSDALDFLLIDHDIFLDGTLRLKETLHGGLSKRHLFQLSLLFLFLGLKFILLLNYLITAVHGVTRTKQVKQLTLYPNIGFTVWVFPLFNRWINALTNL